MEKITFQTKVSDVKGKATIENEVEYTIILKTMDVKAKQMMGELKNWVQIECKRVREP